mgnify:CR=1 FL=1
MFKKIGVAVAFSPRCAAIICEAARLQKIFDAELVLIHVGATKSEEKTYLEELAKSADVNIDKVKYVWEEGNAADKILMVGKREKIDLLVAGAMHRESIMRF